ncbi:sensor histidine kinase [Actinocatenispora rupis]|uniref:histidine kinase n=1 Tax=Actinocatenispora rupis TaxID=519421 RepID=A0A8J3JI56_9ACTN|nr:histidine kinase [Actinocatenispora rupis]GID15408.1 hypothetical protein Aru02nite_62970 [Actinocatenispora rupis]
MLRAGGVAAAAVAEAQRRRVAAEERLRLARELHDVVGHSMASIAVLSGAALHVLDADPSPVRTALTSIRTTSRDAVAELRVALGPRTEGGPDVRPAERVTGLDRLDDLLAAVRAAGVSVDVIRTGSATLVPAVDHAAYRIVQESLTNVLKHAGLGAAATVRITYRDGLVEIEVSNVGDVPALDAGGAVRDRGQGLTGMPGPVWSGRAYSRRSRPRRTA